jgi:hypothetical protein
MINRQPAILIGNALGTIMYGLVVFGIVVHAGLTF